MLIFLYEYCKQYIHRMRSLLIKFFACTILTILFFLKPSLGQSYVLQPHSLYPRIGAFGVELWGGIGSNIINNGLIAEIAFGYIPNFLGNRERGYGIIYSNSVSCWSDSSSFKDNQWEFTQLRRSALGLGYIIGHYRAGNRIWAALCLDEIVKGRQKENFIGMLFEILVYDVEGISYSAILELSKFDFIQMKLGEGINMKFYFKFGLGIIPYYSI